MLNGKEINKLSTGERLLRGLVYLPEDRQSSGLNLDASLAWNVCALTHNLRGFWAKTAKDNATLERYRRALNIKFNQPEQAARTLSGGNQQKVFLARWLDTDADILLLDNPTQGIDIGAKAEIYRLILKLASEGKTILLNTLEIPEIKKVADRCIVFYNGKIAGSLAHSQIDETTVMSYATNAVQLEEVL